MIGFAFRQILRVIACSLLVVSVQAQTPQTPTDPPQEALKLRTELVVVDAQVIDKRSREFIRGLKVQDFDLFEDDSKQHIEFLSQDKLPLSIVLLMDISPSVRPVIEKVREGALQALQRLRPDDEVALMAFAGWTELIQDFTRDRQLIMDKLGVALERKGGGTRIHEAIAKAARQMRYATGPTSRRVIIAITDNQGSMDRYRDAISEEEVKQTVMESGAMVCGVIVRSLLNVADAIIFQYPQIQEYAKRTSVNPYVEQTGGEIASASKDEINARLGEVLDHLRSRYSIGYSPANQNYNGKFRRIRVGLSPEARKRLGGEIAVSARQGYYAADLESEALLAVDQAPAPKNPDTKAQPSVNTPSLSSSAEQPPAAGASPDRPANPPEPKPADRTEAQPSTLDQPRPVKAPNPYSHLVMLDVRAMNKRTGAVADKLAKEDFDLDDNGSKKEILHFSQGQLPLSVILLIDIGGKTPYVMSSLRRNIAQWLRQLGSDDEVALMGFGATAALIQDFTTDRKIIAASLRDFVDNARQKVVLGQDRTAAVFQAAEHMDKAANPVSRRVIIAVTDDSPRSLTAAESGATARLLLDSRSVVYAMVTRGPRPSQKRRIARAAAEGALYSMGNPVSLAVRILTTVASNAVLDAILKDRALGQMIQKTGGEAVRIDGEDATDKLALLLDRIRGRYVVGIEAPVASANPPSGTANRDSFHTLKVKLTPTAAKRNGEVSIATSNGYYVRVIDTNKDPDTVKGVEKQDPKNHH